MILGGAIFLVAVFLALAFVLRIPSMARRAIDTSKTAVATLRDRSLDDDAKERAMQAASIGLFGLFFKIMAASVIALGVPVGLLYLADRVDYLDLNAVLEQTITWPFLIGATVIGFAVWWLVTARRGTAA